MLLIDDMRTELRWPDYAQHAAAHGVLSSLSLPLPFQGATIGAVNTTPDAQGSSTTTMLSWPRTFPPGSRLRPAMQKQHPAAARISHTSAPQ